MSDLIFTIIVFVIVHMVPAIAPLRRALISVLGEAPYIVGFSMMSLGLLGWVGIAYMEAPYVELWLLPQWANWFVVLLMPVATIMLVAVFTNPNPMSVALKSSGYDPAHPGIVSITRHPLLSALLIWSLAHMVINGDLAALILFGFFSIMGLAGPLGIEARKKRKLGEEKWRELSNLTSFMPFWAIMSGRARFDIAGIGWVTVGLGLGLYALLLTFHGAVGGPDIINQM